MSEQRGRGGCNSRASAACSGDLQAVFGLVERNYAGYQDKVERLGIESLQRAQERAASRAREAEPSACLQILEDWLAVFEDRHLGVLEAADDPLAKPAAPPGADDRKRPTFEILSDTAALLRVPSFEGQYQPAIEQCVERHREAILARPDLILDIRGNGGGSDSSYLPLGALVYTQPSLCLGADVLATPENIAAWERLLEHVLPDEREELAASIELMKGQPGVFVEIAADEPIEYAEVLALPRRVAILIDRRCASSCEQFLLEARASRKVRCFGERSAGCLDYANMRPHPLPSGRTLWLATTRSHRLPREAIDGIGIAPDVELDPREFDGPSRREALERVLAQW